jgi:hypothetical protein
MLWWTLRNAPVPILKRCRRLDDHRFDSSKVSNTNFPFIIASTHFLSISTFLGNRDCCAGRNSCMLDRTLLRIRGAGSVTALQERWRLAGARRRPRRCKPTLEPARTRSSGARSVQCTTRAEPECYTVHNIEDEKRKLAHGCPPAHTAVPFVYHPDAGITKSIVYFETPRTATCTEYLT